VSWSAMGASLSFAATDGHLFREQNDDRGLVGGALPYDTYAATEYRCH
jgi:hypothetical protein